MGGGAILGGLWLGQRAHASNLVGIAVASSLLAAVAIVVAIATSTMWVAIPAVAIVGLATSIAGIAIQSSIQLATDHAMRGRVMGLYGLIFRGAPALGALAAGAAAAYFGLRLPIVLGALLVLCAGLWTYVDRERIAAAVKDAEP
jgi:predicted MFS family arabinose efflux permease